jgi:DNA polymerase-3 subunit delta
MDYKTAAKDIAKGNILPIYLCYGPEKHLMQEFISYLLQKVIDPDLIDFAVSRFDLSETSIDDVLDDAETLPFMVPNKVIIAKDAQFFTTAKDTSKVEHRVDKLLDYMKRPAEHAVIVFTVQEDKLDERKKLVKTLKEQGGVIPFLHLTSDALVQWICRQADKLNVSFEEGAVDRLILNAGTNLQSLSLEIEKLSLYAGSGGLIGERIINDLVVRNSEQNVFMLVDKIVNMRLNDAFSIFYELIKQKEEPIKILMLIARQFRIMLQVKELARQGFSHQQMASQLGLHPYAAKLADEQSRKYDGDKLAVILTELAELDYLMKSGKTDKVLGLEMFLLKLAG